VPKTRVYGTCSSYDLNDYNDLASVRLVFPSYPSFLSFLFTERAGSGGHSEDCGGSYRSSVRFFGNPACYFFPLSFCLVFSLLGFFFLEESSSLSPVLDEAFSVGMLLWLGIWCAGVAHQN
jgi:hypothetical protein